MRRAGRETNSGQRDLPGSHVRPQGAAQHSPGGPHSLAGTTFEGVLLKLRHIWGNLPKGHGELSQSQNTPVGTALLGGAPQSSGAGNCWNHEAPNCVTEAPPGPTGLQPPSWGQRVQDLGSKPELSPAASRRSDLPQTPAPYRWLREQR